MKNLIAVLLLSMLVTGTAVAQSKTVRANIPFDFVAGQKSLPAGSYTVRSLGASGDVLGIKTDNSNGAMAMSHPVISSKRADKTTLLFRSYAGEYFLAQVWIEGEQAGRELPITRRERMLAQNHPPLRVPVLAQLGK
jgi:hypothetical protein